MNRQMKRKSLLGLFLVTFLMIALAAHAFALLPGIADDGIIDGTADARNRDDSAHGGNDVNGDGRIDSSQESDGLLTAFDNPNSEPARDTSDIGGTNRETNRPETTGDTAMAGSSSEDGGFSWWGLVIALLIAAAVITLIIMLIPKRDQSNARR